MPSLGAAIHSDLTVPRLTIVCEKCRRHDSYADNRLLAQRGDLRLTDFIAERTADCLKSRGVSLDDRCAAQYLF